MSTLERIREFLRAGRRTDIQICYDSGHGRLPGTLQRLDDVRAIHLNDNSNSADDHLWPFDGRLNWPELAAELVRSNSQGLMVYEVSGPEVERGRKITDRPEALVAEARSSVIKLRRKVLAQTK